MVTEKLGDEQGQALLIGVLLLVGLLVAAGMAIDGGMALLERRRTQNVSDAVAVAGARALLETDDDNTIADVCRTYAASNGVTDAGSNVIAHYVDADSVPLAPVGGGSEPGDATGISVTVRSERLTSFLHLVGINEAPVAAAAVAQTGPPDLEAGVNMGLMPFGIPQETFLDSLEMDGGGEITIHFGNKCGPDVEGNVCTVEHTTAGGTKSQAHRGWWNYNEINDGNCSSGGGASDLQDWMANTWIGTIYDGDKVCSKPGVNASVFDSAPSLPTEAIIPIYACVEDKQYHISHFAAVTLEEVHKGGNDGYIRMSLIEPLHYVRGGAQADPDASADSNLRVVSLVE